MTQPAIPRRGSVTAGGSTLRYSVEGGGTPLLVAGSAVYYPRTFSQRLREHMRLAFVDLRHFAVSDGSPSPEPTTLDTYLEDIETLRVAMGLERFVLVGHSHHGNVAAAYAKRHPERVSHLVLIGTPPCNVPHTIEAAERYWDAEASADRKDTLRRNQATRRREGIPEERTREGFIAQYVAEGPKYWHDPTYDASLLWRGVPVEIDTLDVFRRFFVDYDSLADLMPLPMPVLAVMGRHDYAVPHCLWDEVLPKLQNVSYHLFEQSGHTPQLEEQGLFDQTLIQWLR